FHITHDVFNGSESTFGTGHEVHGQPDTSKDLVNQHQHRQYAEEIPEVEVFRRIVLGHMLFVGLSNRQTIVNPAHQSVLLLAHQAFSSATPATTRLSDSQDYGGITRLSAAGEPLKTRPDRANLEP